MIDQAWTRVEEALAKAQGDDDGFSVDIAYWPEFPKTPWTVSANDIQVSRATLPAALLSLAKALGRASR